jgi:putative endopeptidase
MAPFTVNAYFSPTMNEIVFPAAILQPPFFFAPTSGNPYGEPALNFGAIGAVISHEISHGYDDSGRQYDSNGEIADWWTERDSNAFNSRAKKIVDQFSAFDFAGEKVNGNLTQGENIADLGGVSVSFAAFQKWLAIHPDYRSEASDFNEEQRFFLAYAQVWGNSVRDEAAKQLLATDPHSPGLWRVDGIL